MERVQAGHRPGGAVGSDRDRRQREHLSQVQAARMALDLTIGSSQAPEQALGLLRDLSNRDFTVRLSYQRQRSTPDLTTALPRVRRQLLWVIIAAAAWQGCEQHRTRNSST
ncbi:hypothetical protein ACIBF1_21700 [Spirillospora sp. NPDC050679]